MREAQFKDRSLSQDETWMSVNQLDITDKEKRGKRERGAKGALYILQVKIDTQVYGKTK